ncbi:MAG: hypothetical protein Q8M03_17195, partial [Legionella sp.]|nr:hypothetical protein [Legionella sp.]
MTPRMSVRARAREIYGEMAGEAITSSALPGTPTPNPSPQGGGEQKEAAGAEPSLTARVRALYEKSAVPVREIAAIAGVTERTIYKYVAKGGWTKRYARVSTDTDGVPDVAPVQGAGGRFIRRDDKDKPFATGLKATDPAGR